MLSRKSNAAFKRLLVSDCTSPNVSQSSPKSLNCAIRSLTARHTRQDHHRHFIQPPKKKPGKNHTQRGLLGLERDDIPFQKVLESGARSRQAPLPSRTRVGRHCQLTPCWFPGGLPGTVPVRQVSRPLHTVGPAGWQPYQPHASPLGAIPPLTPFQVSFHLVYNYAQAEVRLCRWQPQK